MLTPGPIPTGDALVPRTRRLRRALAAAAVVGAACTPVVTSPTPAAAVVSNCSKGLSSATKAWGTCRSGSGKWTLTVQCYLWGANTVKGNGPGTIYSTCPSWSHVTDVILRVEY